MTVGLPDFQPSNCQVQTLPGSNAGVPCRAYKLGKKRWLYNECRLTLTAQSGFMPALEILESSRQGEESIPAPINVSI